VSWDQVTSMHPIIKDILRFCLGIILRMPVTASSTSFPEDIFIVRSLSLILPNRWKSAIARFGEHAECKTCSHIPGRRRLRAWRKWEWKMSLIFQSNGMEWNRIEWNGIEWDKIRGIECHWWRKKGFKETNFNDRRSKAKRGETREEGESEEKTKPCARVESGYECFMNIGLFPSVNTAIHIRNFSISSSIYVLKFSSIITFTMRMQFQNGSTGYWDCKMILKRGKKIMKLNDSAQLFISNNSISRLLIEIKIRENSASAAQHPGNNVHRIPDMKRLRGSQKLSPSSEWLN
jgi:hypothetical protein